MSFKEKVFNMLPMKIKKARWTYAKGKISQGAQNDFFFYDAEIIKKLKAISYSQYGQDAFIYHLIWGGQKAAFFWI